MKKKTASNALDWQYEKVPEKILSICIYYEFGRASDTFIKRVLEWRSRQRRYMELAQRFLDCEGSLTLCLDKFVESSDLHLSKQAVKAALNIRKLLENWQKTFEDSPAMLDDDGQEYWDLWYPDDLSPQDPRQFLYRFPLFPQRAWLELTGEQIERAIRIFCGNKIFPIPPVTPQCVTEQPEWASFDPNPLGGTPSWQQTLFNYQSGLMESDTFLDLPPKYAIDDEGKRVWVQGYCHEKVNFVVNWAENDKQITESLKEWLKLKDRRPHKPFLSSKAWKAKNLLMQFRAFRLVKQGVSVKDICGYSTSPAKPFFPISPGSDDALYQDEKSVYRAIKRVEENLDIMFPTGGG